MRNIYRLRFSPSAARNLEEIFEYIQRDSPQNASKVIRRMLDAIDSLSEFPGRYKRLEIRGAVSAPVHSMPVPPYRVRYRIDQGKKAVTILAVRHGARRPE